MAFETYTSCGGTLLATFEGNPYPCGGAALAVFEVVTPTAKMAMPKGHCQDSFVRGACGPDLSGALRPPLAPYQFRIIISTFSSYLSLPEQFAIATPALSITD